MSKSSAADNKTKPTASPAAAVSAARKPLPLPAIRSIPVSGSGVAVPTYSVRVESEPFATFIERTAAAANGSGGGPALPPKLTVEIALPSVGGVSEIELEIDESSGQLLLASSADASHHYKLQLQIPYAVSTDNSLGYATRFHRAKKLLTLVLPVTAPLASTATATAAAAEPALDDPTDSSGPAETAPFVADALIDRKTKSATGTGSGSGGGADIKPLSSKPTTPTTASSGTSSGSGGGSTPAGVDWKAALAFTNTLMLQPASHQIL